MGECARPSVLFVLRSLDSPLPITVALKLGADKSVFEATGAEIMRALQGEFSRFLGEHQHRALRHVVSRQAEGLAIVSMATGTGKTGTAIVAAYYLSCKRVLVVSPRPELADQFDTEFRGDLEKDDQLPFLVKIGLVARDEGSWRPSTDVVSETRELSGTLNKISRFDVVITNTQKWGAVTRADLQAFSATFFDLVIIDEAHQMPSATVRSVFDYFRANNVMVLLLTATPFRTDGQDLLPGMSLAEQEAATFHFGIAEAASKGVIRPVCRVPVFAARNRDIDPRIRDIVASKFVAGSSELVEEETKSAAAYAAVVGAVAAQLEVDDASQPGVRHLALVAAPSNETCNIMASVSRVLYPDLRAAAYHSGKGDTTRRTLLQEFRAGKRRVLFIVGCLVQGFDESKVSVVGMFTPTKSPVRYSQLVGRAIRKLRGVADPLEATVVLSAIHTRRGTNMHAKYLAEKFGRGDREPELDSAEDSVPDMIGGDDDLNVAPSAELTSVTPVGDPEIPEPIDED